MHLEEICLPVKQDLAEVERVVCDHLKSSVPLVTDVAEYVIRNGGKRLRPALCLFASRLVGTSGQKVIDCAAAMEFFHTATLMHDDVIDNAELRRGKPSSNNRWGNQVTVLVGDFFYCQASDLMVGTGNLKAIRLITDAMEATTEGEIFEIAKSNDLGIAEEDYLKIITLKTAVLMSSSCKVGGVLANISDEYVSLLGEYGRCLGMAFQLADDVMDYVSEEDKFGKLKGNDLKEGKLTLPLITTLRQCSPEERRLIQDALIAQKIEEGRLRDILALILKYDGINYTQKLARTYIQKARDALHLFKPGIEKDALLALAAYVVDRQE